MSFLTPPPEFDECIDATSILNNNHCALQDTFYPSPTTTSSSSGHIKSLSYSPHSPSCHNDTLLLEQDQSQPQLFSDNHSSLHFDSAISSTQANNMYNLEAPFAMYEPQNPWSPYQAMTTQYPPLPTGHEDSPAFFSGYHAPESLMPSMLPPTPQPVTPNTFFTTMPMRANETSNYLSSLQQRHAFTPDASTSASMSISSRSCSPNPLSNPGGDIRRRSHARSASIASASSPLSHYGIPVRAPGSAANSAPQAWRCAYPNCTSRATFIRGCDLRKHYNRHSKHLFCRVAGCPQSEAAALAAAQSQDPTCQDPSQLVLSGGFSSKKDRARHEAKHNPGIKCEWQGPDGEECGRLFSRMDNMKDHVRRIHNKGQASPPSGLTSSSDKNRRLKRSSR